MNIDQRTNKQYIPQGNSTGYKIGMLLCYIIWTISIFMYLEELQTFWIFVWICGFIIAVALEFWKDWKTINKKNS